MSIVRLPRRVGFWVRMRARSGLLPGQVSTASLVAARQRFLPLLLVPVLSVALIVLLVAITQQRDTEDRDEVVALVLGPADVRPGAGPHRVVLADGSVMDFVDDPGIAAGETVLVRRGSGSRPHGVTIDGTYAAAIQEPSGADPLALFLILQIVPLLLLPQLIWAGQAHRRIEADLGAPVASAAGTYVGSWQWRGLTAGTAAATAARPLAGVPVAVEDADGAIGWYAAPAELLRDLVAFESDLAAGDRRVAITFHPRTRALATISAIDGSASIDLQRALDVLHPASGLSLKVSRWRRTAHLPDA